MLPFALLPLHSLLNINTGSSKQVECVTFQSAYSEMDILIRFGTLIDFNPPARRYLSLSYEMINLSATVREHKQIMMLPTGLPSP